MKGTVTQERAFTWIRPAKRKRRQRKVHPFEFATPSLGEPIRHTQPARMGSALFIPAESPATCRSYGAPIDRGYVKAGRDRG